MKKFNFLKTIQLILFVCFAVISLFLILVDSRLYQLVAHDPQVRILCILLWLVFVLSFLFIFVDFSIISSFKRDYRELDYAVSSDPVSGIANRYTCDSIIEKYLDQPLPWNIGCIMLELENLGDMNRDFGHVTGNALIHEFSGILQASALNLCFVGRNGGNIFLALFENCSDKKMDTFLERVSNKVYRHNSQEDVHPVRYRYGIAFDEASKVKTVTDLIALSDRRIYDRSE